MGGINFDEVLRWSESEVCAWLQSVRLGQHAATFARNDIPGAVLFDLDAPTLKEMGVATVGDRIRVTSAIKKLKKQCLDAEAIVFSANEVVHQQQTGGSASSLSFRPPAGPVSAVTSPASYGGHFSQQQPYASGQPRLGHQRTTSSSNSDSIEWVDGEMTRRGSSTHPSSSLPLRTSPLPPQTYGTSSGSSDHHASSPTSASGSRSHQTLREIRSMGGNTLNAARARDSSIGTSRAAPQQAQHRNAYETRPSTATNAVAPSAPFDASPTTATFPLARPSTADGTRVATGHSPASAPSALPLTPIAENAGGLARHPYAMGPYHQAGPEPSRVVSPQYPPPSIDDVKKKTIKFIGEDGTTKILAVSDCRDAYDVLARVLRKFNKPASSNVYTATAGQTVPADDGADGDGTNETWGILAMSSEGHTKFLTDNELLAVCHAPQPHDPLRERGLILRRIHKSDEPTKRHTPRRSKLESFFGVASDKMSSHHFDPADESLVAGHVTTEGKRMNRASTMSILSGLGVSAARDRDSGSSSLAGHRRDSGMPSPSSLIPKKARNFRGQRPPSELISSHLADYFPSTEKRVLERTARKSIYGRPSTSIRSKRDSTWSFAADPDAPPLPSKEGPDGQGPAILIGMDRSDSSDSPHMSSQQAPILPPVRSSLDGWTRSVHHAGSMASTSVRNSARPPSFRRTSGESARSRHSLASKLRLARGISSGAGDEFGRPKSSSFKKSDRSETASLLTVDEITQEVESRRESASLHSSGADWVVDEDGIPIPSPLPSHDKTTSSSVAGSTRRSSQLSSADVAESPDEAGDDVTTRSSGELQPDRSAPPDAPGEETDRHFGDPMAVTSFSDEDDPDDGLDTDDDYGDGDLSDEEVGDGRGVYKSAAPGREPIKWIKGALIGAGSFGNVFLGMNARNGLLMAVKQVELPSGHSHSDQRKKGMLEALEREIELLKTLQHDNIVQYLDSYADGTHLNIFLEYVPGGSVAALLRNYGAFQESLVRNFVKQILHGLNFLHTRDIVHRDIKGANILVDNKSCIKISDFGISKKVESDLYVTSRAHRPSLQGSVFWMAPEVVKQTSYTRKADIWSLGCLVVEMISGTHPWANLNQMQALYQIGSHAKPSLPDEMSPEAVDFLNKTFELDHNKRPSGEELLQHPFVTTDIAQSAESPGDKTSSLSTLDEGSSTAFSLSSYGNGSVAAKEGTVKARGKAAAGGGRKGGGGANKDAAALEHPSSAVATAAPAAATAADA